MSTPKELEFELDGQRYITEKIGGIFVSREIPDKPSDQSETEDGNWSSGCFGPTGLSIPLFSDARFGSRLRELRQELGISQQALSIRAGLNHGYVNRAESKRRLTPLGMTVLKLVGALGLDVQSEEAVELVRLAGHNPMILETDGSPQTEPPRFTPRPRLPRFLNGLE